MTTRRFRLQITSVQRQFLRLTEWGICILVCMLIPLTCVAQEGIPCNPEPTDMSISYGHVITCSIGAAGDVDQYRFQAVAGEVVVIQTTSTSVGASACIELFRPNGTLVGLRCGGTARIDTTLDQTGTYTIRVSEQNNDRAMGYTLALERLITPSPVARSVSFAQELNDNVNPTGDLDTFFFNATVGNVITLQATSTSVGASACVELFQPDGTRVGGPVCGGTARIDATLDQSGRYLFLITEQNNDRNMGYTLSLSCVICPPACAFALMPSRQSFASAGGVATVGVTTSAGCAWTAESSTPWVMITSPPSASGNGEVSFSVGPNIGFARIETLTIGDQLFIVRQSANFADLDPTSAFAPFIEKLSAAGITVGCGRDCDGRPLYCPSAMVTREQMAAFVIRAVGMPNPPTPSSQRFLDVPPSSGFYAFIDQMAIRGITVGCNPPDGTLYCPGANVTRDQMAAFIIRALGMQNPPPPASQRFLDVPPSNIFYAFIDQMAIRGITVGCNPPDSTMYCPSSNVTRDQMAAFLVRAFAL